ncbi:hypothetical protein M427DRAFT_134753 [Gonapodya prolifera JEL478]|uniref:Uncharacterized protein n=1 Tax=Gonapodya prolifera (strain JEL478) TaxID=1344416 RepID=A0A139AGK7_GONPJ|nr:hypothetical protein M427DRAFT_134753 [Gonapodya prolifera JEL478]|eukprot:KXS15962.1 hypothetical protein M427DRAFT_134753 [Gonapodya prolifera JEL478]
MPPNPLHSFHPKSVHASPSHSDPGEPPCNTPCQSPYYSFHLAFPSNGGTPAPTPGMTQFRREPTGNSAA